MVGRIDIVAVVSELRCEGEIVPLVDHMHGCGREAAVILRSLAVELTVFEGETECRIDRRIGKLVNAADVDLVLLLIAIAGLVHHIIAFCSSVYQVLGRRFIFNILPSVLRLNLALAI